MIFNRMDPFTGQENEMDLPVTEEQFRMWSQGTPIQAAMPHLTPDQREFIISGITADSWNTTFGSKCCDG